MRASRQESSLSLDEIPLSVKSSCYRLREYRNISRERRMIERYRSDASLVDLNEIPVPPLDLGPICMMLLKEYLIRGMDAG